MGQHRAEGKGAALKAEMWVQTRDLGSNQTRATLTSFLTYQMGIIISSHRAKGRGEVYLLRV